MILTLVIFLLLASWIDCKHFRIPNSLTLMAAVAGLLHSTYAGNGILFPLSGGIIGLALFILPYAYGKMGAGDVKMLAAVGTFLGPVTVIWAALWSFIAGGILALFWVFYLRIRPESAFVPSGGMRHDRHENLGKSQRSTMPYALAISIGSLIAFYQVMDI